MEIDPKYQFLTLKEVISLTKRSAPTLYRWVSQGKFPKSIKLADTKSAVWRLSDYQAWAEDPQGWRSPQTPQG